MGEYYTWINVDKREYIDPLDFDEGLKLYSLTASKSKTNAALHMALSNRWKHDHIVCLGDERLIDHDTSNVTLKKIIDQFIEYHIDDMTDLLWRKYYDISLMFKGSEERMGEFLSQLKRELIYFNTKEFPLPLNPYRLYDINPKKHLFYVTPKRFRYLLNYSKRVAYLPESVAFYDNGNRLDDLCDPLPYLMCYGRVRDTGPWLGDRIGTSDVIPENFRMLNEVRFD